jgi:hypothetical protein
MTYQNCIIYKQKVFDFSCALTDDREF